MAQRKAPIVPLSVIASGQDPHKIKPQTMTTIAIPPLWAGTQLIAGWDPADGSIRVFNLGTFHEGQVLAEQQHIIGILDGRRVHTAVLAGDMTTTTIPVGTVVGAVAATQRATITVPAGEVWFIQTVALTSPAESAPAAGEIVTENFRTTVIPDVGAAPNALGYPYFGGSPMDYVWTIALETWFCEFSIQAPTWDYKYMQPILRLPPASTITLESILTGAAAGAALTSTMHLYGYKGKYLVT